MFKGDKVGKKIYLLVANVGDDIVGFGTATFLTRSHARSCKSDKDFIVEVPLSAYQQKRLQELNGN